MSHFQRLKLASAIGLTLALISGGVAAETIGQTLTDARQETQIWTTYALSRHLRANDLKVSVQDGKATLTGKVDDDVNKALAKEIALGVDGIKQVDNQILVESDYVPAKPATRSYGEVIDDASISATVKSKLLWSKSTEGLATQVETRAGTVTLKGTADSGAAKELAGRMAMNTRGVVAVDNQLQVKAGEPSVTDSAKSAAADAERGITDSWITTKVKSTLLYSSNVEGSAIEVNTKSGVVSLSGKLSSDAERALAVELAQNVRGVRSVQAKGLTL